MKLVVSIFMPLAFLALFYYSTQSLKDAITYTTFLLAYWIYIEAKKK